MKHIYILVTIMMGMNAYAREWFVAVNGVAGQSGTITTPITLQNAGDRAVAGDIVYIRSGKYKPTNNYTPLLKYTKGGGTEGKPIIFRNYPLDADRPELVPYEGTTNYVGSGSWALIKVYTDATTPTVIPKYLIFEGLLLRGKNTMMRAEESSLFEQQMGQYCPDNNKNGFADDDCIKDCPDEDGDRVPEGCEDVRYNGQGILVTGPFAWDPEIKKLIPRHNFPNGANPYAIPHHITVRNCIVKEFPGAGMSFQRADYITVENCEIANNCWYTIFGSSGINFYQMVPFEGRNAVYVDTVYRIKVINNVVYGNTLKVRNQNLPVRYDGNGIIIDDLIHAQDYVVGNIYTNPNRGIWQYGKYQGRVLVANNIIFGNGGSGIKVYSSQKTDVIHNTLYNNGIGNYAEDRTRAGNPYQRSLFVQEIVDEQTKMWLMDGENRVFNNIAFNTIGYPTEGITPQQLAFSVASGNFSYNNLVLDPSFRSIAANVSPSPANVPTGIIANIKDDLKLNSNSKAINYGIYCNDPILDILRFTRDALPDAGAYETGTACVEKILVGNSTATIPAGLSSNIGATERKVYRAQKSITFQRVYVTQSGAVVSTEIAQCNTTPVPGRIAYGDNDLFESYEYESENTDLNSFIYPNPISSGMLHFKDFVYKYTIYNVTGKEVSQGHEVNGINIDGFPKGIYILHFDGNVQKVIIE